MGLPLGPGKFLKMTNMLYFTSLKRVVHVNAKSCSKSKRREEPTRRLWIRVNVVKRHEYLI